MNESSFKIVLIVIIGIGLTIGLYPKFQEKVEVVHFTAEAVPKNFVQGYYSSRSGRGPSITYKIQNSTYPSINGKELNVSQTELYNEAKTNQIEITLDKCPVIEVSGTAIVTTEDKSQDLSISDVNLVSWKWCPESKK